MQIVKIPSVSEYSNLYTLSGYSAGQNLVVTNNTSQTIYIVQSPTKPLDNSDGYFVGVKETVFIVGTSDPIWIRGSKGKVSVQLQQTGIVPYTGTTTLVGGGGSFPSVGTQSFGGQSYLNTTMPPEDYATISGERFLQVELPSENYTTTFSKKKLKVDLPPDMYSSTSENYRRLRVDVGQTGFFRGREARSFFEFNIPANNVQIIKFVSPVNFILIEQSVSVDAGSIRFQALTGATEVATFNTSVPIFGKNRMTERESPFYNFQVTITTHAAPVAFGSGITGGTVTENVRVVAANATAQQQTVSGGAQTERGLPAGTYYLRLHNFGSGAATGVYSLVWEERP